MSVDDGFGSCRSAVPVKVQHREHGRWKTLDTVMTAANGSYALSDVTDAGRYRAVAKQLTLGSGDVCLLRKSPSATK